MKTALLVSVACAALALAGCQSQNSGAPGQDYNYSSGSGVSTKGEYDPNSATENPRGSWNGDHGQSGVGQTPSAPSNPDHQ